MFSDPQFWVAVAFVAFIVAIFNPVRKILTSSLDTQIKDIKNKIDEAENLKNETQTTLSEIKKRQNDVQIEIQDIHKDAEKKVKQLEENAEAKLKDQIAKRQILAEANLKIIDVQMNGINGGSFAVTAAKKNCLLKENNAVINWLLDQEKAMGLNSIKPYQDFETNVFRHREDLVRLINALNADGKTILGYGASTKGNVMLQFCGFTPNDIPAIAEVNEDKFGCFCPGTGIPIISEAEARSMNPDYFIVMPWHFKNGILEREKEFLERGGKMIFPFPEIEII